MTELDKERRTGYFSPEFFRFLKALSRNNNREWFQKNKSRYEKFVQTPSLRFIKDASKELKAISPYLIADPKPFGGSLFRIYRDIRFSKDRSPYKTHVAMEFWHKKRGKKAYTGLYLRLTPGQSFAGAGIWHPDAPTLYKVRSAIVSRPEAWRKVKQAGLRIEGESLKKPPSGFDPTHPFIEDLKLKDLTAGVHFTDAQVIGPRFMKDFIQAGKMLNPLNKFLADALGVPW
ncbi:MAG TPA: TIGR02453 family protein [Candidatus Bathyarchaeia archaeon]|nr:TIGR02453 family protein [Candidatus Bathyarchaeia archaeon]